MGPLCGVACRAKLDSVRNENIKNFFLLLFRLSDKALTLFSIMEECRSEAEYDFRRKYELFEKLLRKANSKFDSFSSQKGLFRAFEERQKRSKFWPLPLDVAVEKALLEMFEPSRPLLPSRIRNHKLIFYIAPMSNT